MSRGDEGTAWHRTVVFHLAVADWLESEVVRARFRERQQRETNAMLRPELKPYPGLRTVLSPLRREDLHFMAATGETAEGAAKRIGINVNSLGAWALRNEPAAWARLLANADRPARLQTGHIHDRGVSA